MDDHDFGETEEEFDDSELDDFEYIEHSGNEDFYDYPTEQEEDLSDAPRRDPMRDIVAGIAERHESLDRQYQEILDEIETGKRSIEVGEIDLWSIRYKKRRLDTQAEMAQMGLSYFALSAVSDDYNCLLRDDPSYPEGGRIRQQFQSLQEDEQEEVLRRAIENERITEQQAEWFRAYWR